MRLLTLLIIPLLAGYAYSLGEPSPINEQDESSTSFKLSLREAVKMYNARSNSMYHHALFRYEPISKQIVAGVLYRFKMILARTSCRNNDQNRQKSIRECPLASANAPAESCEFSVLWRTWAEPNYMVNDPTKCKRVTRIEKRDLQHDVILGHDDHDVGHRGQFEELKSTHKKTYKTQAEEDYRFIIFRKNMKKAYSYQLLDHGSARYGATEFADLTEEEFKSTHLTPDWDVNKRPMRLSDVKLMDNLPDSFDWREKGAVTGVKNQGSCGSCWAFSTTGNIEGQWFIAKKKLVSLSEQELVDCDKVDLGCNGGLPSQAYKEIIRLGGLEPEVDYPYKGRNMKCSFNRTEVAVYINDSVSISKNETLIANWLVQHGPISIGINANAMQFYMGGVAHPWKIFCNPSHLDHGVLIVGFGKKGSEPYWIIKNSWGASWGEKGYYLVYRGDGTCGLNTMCTSAVVK